MDGVSDIAVSVTEVRKRYGDLWALDGATFAIDSGECFALLGPNGAGKTTITEILEGYRHRDSGDAQVLGVAAQRATLGPLAEFSARANFATLDAKDGMPMMMLYDNAGLTQAYLEAFQLTGNLRFAQVARETLGYVLREMTSPEGGFYSLPERRFGPGVVLLGEPGSGKTTALLELLLRPVEALVRLLVVEQPPHGAPARELADPVRDVVADHGARPGREDHEEHVEVARAGERAFHPEAAGAADGPGAQELGSQHHRRRPEARRTHQDQVLQQDHQCNQQCGQMIGLRLRS